MNYPAPLFLASLLALFVASSTFALERISIQRGGEPIRVSGKVLVEAEDGGLLVCDLAGLYWMIQPAEIVQRTSDDVPFQPHDAKKVADHLLAELPDGFRIHETAHYVICYNTSTAYAEWCGALFERLYRAFYGYWSNLDFELQQPEMPLVALVFSDHKSYSLFASKQLGSDIGSTVGYYNVQTNRVNTYDLTGMADVRPQGRISSTKLVNQVLSQPRAVATVATIVHEATHQLAYNSGLQVRLAVNPFWVSEGLAVYFETPDLKSSRGWRGIGNVNQLKLERFGRYLTHRPADSLITLLADDRRFRELETSSDSYAEAWSLNYYLLRTHKKDYVAYLKKLAQRNPLIPYGAEERVAEFQAYFGADLMDFDKQFIRYMQATLSRHR